MRNKLTLILITLLVYACTRPSEDLQEQHNSIIKESGDPLLFKVIPLSQNKLKVSFRYDQNRSLEKLILKKDTATVGTYVINNDNNSFYSTEINYNFSSGEKYNFIVQSGSLHDTIYQYSISGYTHNYVSAYDYQKVLNINQNVGFNAYDISPSRKTIFINDYSSSNFTFTLKRLSLTDLKTDTIAGDAAGLMVRALSDDEILITTGGKYNNRFPGGDSNALMRYNINTKQSVFIDWVSQSYGRTSRIINNHVLVTNPYFTGTTTLINLNDNSKRVYPSSSINFTTVRDNNFDNIYSYNTVVDANTGNLVNVLDVADTATIEYIDDANQEIIVSQYKFSPPPSQTYNSRFAIYKQNNKIYESEYSTGRNLVFNKINAIKNNSILFYQYFGYATTFRIDGDYVLNTDTKETTLVQCESTPYITNNFPLDDHTIISVRADGIYKLTSR